MRLLRVVGEIMIVDTQEGESMIDRQKKGRKNIRERKKERTKDETNEQPNKQRRKGIEKGEK